MSGQCFLLGSTAQTIRAVLLANATATTFAGLRAGKMTAPPRRRRCNTITSSSDAAFAAPASPRAYPRVFYAAALVSPRLLPRPRSQELRRALLPRLLRGSRRGTSASFEACCHLLPCILSPWAPGVSRKCCRPNPRVKSGLPRDRFPTAVKVTGHAISRLSYHCPYGDFYSFLSSIAANVRKHLQEHIRF